MVISFLNQLVFCQILEHLLIHLRYQVHIIYSTSLVIIVPPSACMCEILNKKCFPQKVHHETIGRHSDISDSFSLCVCVRMCILLFPCAVSYVVCFLTKHVYLHVCVSVTTAMGTVIICPLDRLNSEAPQPWLCNTHTPPRSMRPSVCVGVDPLTTCVWWVVSAVRSWYLRHQLPSAMPETICPSWCWYSQAKTCNIGPLRAKLCRAVPDPCWIYLQSVKGGWGWGRWEHGFGMQLQNS